VGGVERMNISITCAYAAVGAYGMNMLIFFCCLWIDTADNLRCLQIQSMLGTSLVSAS
jgi:hypothetical protein